MEHNIVKLSPEHQFANSGILGEGKGLHQLEALRAAA
jgi:hypothetical protein